MVTKYRLYIDEIGNLTVDTREASSGGYAVLTPGRWRRQPLAGGTAVGVPSVARPWRNTGASGSDAKLVRTTPFQAFAKNTLTPRW